MHSQGDSSVALELERLTPDSVAVAMRAADCAGLLSGVQRCLPDQAAAHPQTKAHGPDELWLGPVLTPHETIAARACPSTFDGTLPWAIEGNRSALRGLVRALRWHWSCLENGQAMALAEMLLHLDHYDSHGVRLILVNEYLRGGRDEKALALAEQYPRDLAPETRFGAVLALVRSKRLQEAERALRRARSELPKMAQSLRPQMHGVWQQTPGALEWLRAHS